VSGGQGSLPHLSPGRVAAVVGGGALLVAGVSALAVLYGTEGISLLRVIAEPGSVDADIVLRLRLPRVLAGLAAGAALAVAGVTFQALLRNPLADPYILGVSGGAALGGTLALVLVGGAAVGARLLVPAGAFSGALLAVVASFSLARTAGRVSTYQALLTGVVLNAFASAAIMFVKTVVEARKAQEILIWLMGTLAVEGVEPGLLLASSLAALAGTVALTAQARPLNALALGDETAAALGLEVERSKRRLLLLASLSVGVVVPVVGLVGFVGLVVPHALRLAITADHRLLLPAAALYGGAFLVACDLVSRLLFPVLATETPVGVVTAFAGGPLFVWLLRRQAAVHAGGPS